MTEQKLIAFTPDQVIVNEYLKDRAIAAHVNCLPSFGNTIISLSSCGPCLMNFEKEPNSKAKVEIHLEPRSLVNMREEARFE